MTYVQFDLVRVMRAEEYASLAGVDDSPAADAEAELIQALANLREFRNHAHQWSGSGFCVSCGADGNA